MEKNSKQNGVTGISFSGVLTTVFIVLKLCGVITWSWVWVLSPTWITWGIILLIVVVLILFAKK